ncbi:MAG TPA: hypothetical protein VN784_09195 [Candidatus Limnocylindrales bacterium]|nr:hypothetical protein [Candidatus Limnocylindrales bacterium]
MKNAPRKSTKSNPAPIINIRLKKRTFMKLDTIARQCGLTFDELVLKIVERQLPRFEGGKFPTQGGRQVFKGRV